MRAVRGYRNHNLPVQRVRLIGREVDTATVREKVLEEEGHLVTLTGAGGCGKTRLALQVATNLVDAYPDGVWLVEFASLVDATLVPEVVASALGINQQPGGSIVDTLVVRLRQRHMLLVLDNCEHLVEACAHLTDTLLGVCPGLRLLTTSREPLRVTGEVIWRVPSLAVPDVGRAVHLEELAGSSAVRLFVERARAVKQDFELTPANAHAVARICAQLDGLPLALELAAARVRAMSAAQIAERLDHGFRLLSGGSRTAPSRQQTLKATLDWSHALLSVPERAVFRRLAVFAGGWDLEAAEAVCASRGIEETDVLELLSRLVDRSLVQADEGRYRFLEPIRQYAHQLLTSHNEWETAAARHEAHYLDVAEQAAATLWGSHVTGPFGSAEQIEWQAHLQGEHDNLRAGLAWVENAGQPETLARWCIALWGFWFLHGHFNECRRWLQAALAPGPKVPPGLRARLLGPWGMMAKLRGDYASAVRSFEESLALFRAIGDDWHSAVQLNVVGMVLGNKGDFVEARRRLEESVALARAMGDEWVIAFGLLNFGQVLRDEGDLAGARVLLEEALPLFHSQGDVFKELVTQIELGGLALDQDELEKAATGARDGLLLLEASGMRWYLPEALELVAGLSATCGRPHQSARLFGAAEAAREVTGAVLQPQGQRAYARDLQTVRAGLGVEEFTRAWADGRALPLEGSISEALIEIEALPLPAISPAVGARADGVALTHREREVAELIAGGLTNRQIAEQLVISQRTADRHVSNILDKLNLARRGQIAAWAAGQNGQGHA